MPYLVLRERIELSTSPLPRECSTTELPQRAGRWTRAREKPGFDAGVGLLAIWNGAPQARLLQPNGSGERGSCAAACASREGRGCSCSTAAEWGAVGLPKARERCKRDGRGRHDQKRRRDLVPGA